VKLILALSIGLFSFTSRAWANPISDKFEVPAFENSHIQTGYTSETSLDPANIKVLVWNIYKAGKKSFAADFKKLASDRDVLMIQEAETNQDMMSVLDQFSGFQFDLGVSFITKKTGAATGTMIGSPVEKINFAILRTKELEPIVLTPKAVTAATFPIKGMDTELLVINIHGLNMTENTDFVKQLLSCEKLIAAHKGPVIFAGDFNTSDIDKLNAMMSLSFRQGMYTVGFKNDRRRKSTFSRLLIDHTFIRGLKVLDADVPNVKGSDHKAMKMEFAVSE